MSKCYGLFETGDFHPGQRVELHPGTDRWMRGDRYATVVSIGKSRQGRDPLIHLKMDASEQTIRIHPYNIGAIIS